MSQNTWGRNSCVSTSMTSESGTIQTRSSPGQQASSVQRPINCRSKTRNISPSGARPARINCIAELLLTATVTAFQLCCAKRILFSVCLCVSLFLLKLKKNYGSEIMSLDTHRSTYCGEQRNIKIWWHSTLIFTLRIFCEFCLKATLLCEKSRLAKQQTLWFFLIFLPHVLLCYWLQFNIVLTSVF